MKIVILNARNRFRKQDLALLDEHETTFYELEDTSLESLKELSEDGEVILGVQPSYIQHAYQGLEIERLKKIPKLKGVCLTTTAYGWAPFEELGKMNIPVTNVPGKSTDSVAEYYVFMMVALLRKLPIIIKNDWTFTYGPELLGTDAKGLHVGIIGLGKIGTSIADLCHAYGMHISYWNRSIKHSSYQLQDLNTIFLSSDIIFVTTVADSSTKNMITNQMIDSMKSTAIFLSPIDPLVFDRNYILHKVAKNELGGFGFETHTRKVGEFKGNVFPAPEVGYFTHQTLEKESQIFTESLLSIVDGKPVNVVNL